MRIDGPRAKHRLAFVQAVFKRNLPQLQHDRICGAPRALPFSFLFLTALFLFASATAHAQLSFNPAALNFGTMSVGSSRTAAMVIANLGKSSLIVSSETMNVPGFTVTGFSKAVFLGPSKSFTVYVTFAPKTAGAVAGTVSYEISLSKATPGFKISGTGVQSLEPLFVSPASVTFGSVSEGVTDSQSLQLKNPNSSSVSISNDTISGTGFKLTGLTAPLTLAAGATHTFTVTFSPSTAGAETGRVSISGSAGSLAIALSGTGVASQRVLSASATSLSFGSVSIGKAATLAVSLKNTGNASVTVSSVTHTGSGLTTTGVGASTVLNAGQTGTLDVDFTPTAAGSVSGSVTVNSNASDSAVTISVSGTGVTTTTYSVALSWSPSSSSGVTGYNVYRSTTSGQNYSRIASSVSSTSYKDSTVQASTDYYYVVTSISSSGAESGYSSQISADVP